MENAIKSDEVAKIFKAAMESPIQTMTLVKDDSGTSIIFKDNKKCELGSAGSEK